MGKFRLRYGTLRPVPHRIFRIQIRFAFNCSCRSDCGLCKAVISVMPNICSGGGVDVFGEPWSHLGQACNNCQHDTTVTLRFTLLCSISLYHWPPDHL